MAKPKIEIYSGAHCSYCTMAKKWFDSKNLSYHELRIDQDPSLREDMQKRTNGARTIPQIFINDQLIGGYDDLMTLVHNNDIDKLISE